MKGYLIEDEDVSYMDSLLYKDGKIIPVAASELYKLPASHLMIWGNKNGVYTYPTIELIDWIKNEIDDKFAIEICSGFGTIGRALNITRTDSCIQTTPEMVAFYKLHNQVPIFPAEDVLKYEALEAVQNFKPQVVVGCYVTQKYKDGDEISRTNSSVYGVDEEKMLSMIEKYINVGNFTTHGDKRIRKHNHKTYKFPWIITRSGQPIHNEIVVYEGLKNG